MQGGLVLTRCLRHELRFRCYDDAAYDCLRFVDTRPAMDLSGLHPVEVSVRARDGSFSLTGPGVDVSCPPEGLLDASHRIIRDILVDEVRDGVLLHAASMNVGGRNLALLGEKGTGKTTLALKALEAGHDVFGDEHVFFDGACAMTRPRTLRVKEASLGLVPGMAAAVRRCPHLVNWDGSRIYSYPPENGAAGWRLHAHSIDHVIHLKPNHDGASRLEEIRPEHVYPVAMEQCFVPAEHQGKALALLWNALRSARTWQLELGELGGALAALEQLP